MFAGVVVGVGVGVGMRVAVGSSVVLGVAVGVGSGVDVAVATGVVTSGCSGEGCESSHAEIKAIAMKHRNPIPASQERLFPGWLAYLIANLKRPPVSGAGNIVVNIAHKGLHLHARRSGLNWPQSLMARHLRKARIWPLTQEPSGGDFGSVGFPESTL